MGLTGSQDRPPLPAAVVSAVALSLAALYAVLIPMHLRVVAEPNSTVTAGIAAVTVCALLWAWWHVHSGRVRSLRLVAALVAAAPIVNSLGHIAATGSIDETPVLGLTVVAIGAALTSWQDALGLVAGALAGWALVVAARVDEPGPHAAVQLLIAAVLSATLHVVRRRSEQGLSDARDALAEEVETSRSAATALTESEQRFREVFTGSPVGLALADEDGRFVTVNAALLRLLDRPAEEVIGRSSVQFTHPDDLAAHGAASELLRSARQGAAQVEKRYVRPDGEVRWSWLTIARTSGPQGQQWTLAHVQDVTDRKLAEQTLADSELNLAAVARVTHRIQAGEDVRSTIVEAAVELADASMVFLCEPDDDALVVTSSAGLDLDGVRLSYGQTSATLETFRTGGMTFVPNTHESALMSPVMRDVTGAESALFQPVERQGQTVAVLTVLWTNRVALLSDRAAGAVALLADEMAVALSQETMRSELQESARTDPLTALPNRREWDTRLEAVLAVARRSGEPVVVALADLDHFKHLNDAQGHGAGDAHLRAFAREARQSLREVDVIARWGGEEFAIAMPGCAEEVAEIVLARVRAAVPGGETVSVGWATWDGIETPEELLRRVDEALYAAKAAGRDRVMPAG